MSDETQERWPVAKHSINFTLRQDVDGVLASTANALGLSKAELIRRIVLGWMDWHAKGGNDDDHLRLAFAGWDGAELVR